MKIVFFSPFARVSAIGRVTALLVDALDRQGHTSVVVRTERESLLDLPPHSVAVPVLPWIDEEQVRAVAQDADAIVYQMGNNYGFHRGGLHWMPLLPGVLCLHDFVLAHLFAEWADHHREQAESALEDWYGSSAVQGFFEACASTPQRFSDVASRHYPLTEWICTEALAVVAHSDWGMDRVQSACAGPLRVLPLPYDAPGASGPAQDARTSLAEDKVRVLTVGHVNTNKRIDSVIRAIGASPILRSRVSYRLCGLVQARTAEELAALARSLGVDLIISGECDDASLQLAMIEADIACCLRWPSFESASATAIEALLYGKAVVVTDAAFYRELPDHVVRKIPPDVEEVSVLMRVLEEWVQDPQARRSLATTAQHWARERFNPDHYVRQLLALAPQVAVARPVIEMARQLGAMVEGWNGAPALLAAEQLVEPLRIFQTAPPAAPEKPS
ncbi:MAG: glycosyltransferase family 1 protein [Hyphomicrobiales bacterium]|nr:MAG: glycosyltransferase family 1 protein [Hyphomicrobiales bacterium]